MPTVTTPSSHEMSASPPPVRLGDDAARSIRTKAWYRGVAARAGSSRPSDLDRLFDTVISRQFSKYKRGLHLPDTHAELVNQRLPGTRALLRFGPAGLFVPMFREADECWSLLSFLDEEGRLQVDRSEPLDHCIDRACRVVAGELEVGFVHGMRHLVELVALFRLQHEAAAHARSGAEGLWELAGLLAMVSAEVIGTLAALGLGTPLFAWMQELHLHRIAGDRRWKIAMTPAEAEAYPHEPLAVIRRNPQLLKLHPYFSSMPTLLERLCPA